MLKKLKVTSHAFIFCLFGFTLMTVFLFSPNVYAQASGTDIQNEAQGNLMINNQRIPTWADIKWLNKELDIITKKLTDLQEQVHSDAKRLYVLEKQVIGMYKDNKNGEDTGLKLELDTSNGDIERDDDCGQRNGC